jgi:hypothetical protein
MALALGGLAQASPAIFETLPGPVEQDPPNEAPAASAPAAALGPPVRGRLRPTESHKGALTFGDAILESFAGGKRLDFAAWIDVERGSDIVAIGREIILDDVRDARGRRPIAHRMSTGTLFSAPVQFDTMQTRVALHGRQASLPVDARGPLRVGGRVPVLRAREVLRPELAPRPTAGARTLAPGLSLELRSFEPLAREPEHWQVAGRWGRQVPSARNRFATPFVRALVLVDDAGDEIWRSPWPEAYLHEGALVGDFSVRFELADGRKPAALRVEIVTAAREDSIPFAVDLLP